LIRTTVRSGSERDKTHLYPMAVIIGSYFVMKTISYPRISERSEN